MPQLGRKRERPPVEPDLRDRVQRDLEARGVSPALARPVAARVAPHARGLEDPAYEAFLDGVAAAHGGVATAAVPEAGAAEIQRLVQDFAVELKKLDEGLRLLSAYLLLSLIHI